MSGLKVVNPGMLCLIQDLGRFGVAHHGLSAGGPDWLPGVASADIFYLDSSFLGHLVISFSM